MGQSTEAGRRPSGFTVIELLTVVAILGILAALAITGIIQIRGYASRRANAADLYGMMAHARTRALARQRTQLVVIDAAGSANGTFGFYHLEDASTTPNIFLPADLQAIAVLAFNPDKLSTTPAGYSLTGVDQEVTARNPFYMNTDAMMGKPLPFPWSSLATTVNGPVSTLAGCSFCSGNQDATGIVGFLPNGRAIFSDANVRGGLIVMQATRPDGSVSSVTGIGVSPSGFVQQLGQQ